MNLRISLSLMLGAATALCADLPIKQVVLYKHGVGFFERSGTLGAGESARLDFNATEMNDVLKSLTIGTSGGAKVTGLRYDSMDPLSHALEAFPFQIGDAQPLSGLLDQLKGARVEIKLGDRTVTGVVVGGRMTAATNTQPEREQLTLLMDDGEVRTLDLGAANGLRFGDARLQSQFKDYLAMVATARSKDKRAVYIDAAGTKEREIVASYTVPQPVWKSSYRLIFGATGQPVIEGWAMVDNTSGEDWTNVALSLVSGRPISFVSQLYAPKYVQRPTADLPDDAAARPVIHEGDFEATLKVPPPPPPAAAAPRAFMAHKGEALGISGGVLGSIMTNAVAPSSIVSDATAREMGELFEYRISQPVTIHKNESALLPFLQQKIDSRKLLIYSGGSSEHPTNAAELTNSTGKTLDGGPITIYDGGAYGGEALMETLKSGDKRLISYAVDLGTRVTTAFGGKAAVTREIHANRGVVTTRLAAEETRTYTARNVDQKAKTLIIEHPLRPGYTLLNQKATEKTSSAYRFEIALAAGATREFAVSEERVYDQSYAVSNMTPDAMLEYVSNRELSDAGRRQLQQIAAQKRQVADNATALNDAAAEVTSLTNDETRIRQNIGSLNGVSGQQQQVQNYARQLDEHERQLAALRDKQAELRKQKTALEAGLAGMIDALTF
jgi:chaperonin cofactor prefoldin